MGTKLVWPARVNKILLIIIKIKDLYTIKSEINVKLKICLKLLLILHAFSSYKKRF